MDAHKVASDAPREACAEGGPSIRGQGEALLLMVEYPEDSNSSESVLRSINELQQGGTLKQVIPYRRWCAYTLFQGESAKSCPRANQLYLNILTLERFPWRSVVMTLSIRHLLSLTCFQKRSKKNFVFISNALNQLQQTTNVMHF